MPTGIQMNTLNERTDRNRIKIKRPPNRKRNHTKNTEVKCAFNENEMKLKFNPMKTRRIGIQHEPIQNLHRNPTDINLDANPALKRKLIQMRINS